MNAKNSQRSDGVIPAQDVPFTCGCGKVHLVKGVRHYDKFILSCGKAVWALQPKRFGPLVLLPWPGPPMSARQLADKEGAERAEGWQAGRWHT